MRIQHNISALNAHRQLGVNNNAVSRNLEKLSSGYAINRAGDNAAGLAISEKMRGQIRGLDQAQANAQDGISLIQTAEGGLNETHAILQRMREIAAQSANGTYQDEVDRENLQQETEALKSEIDRIASSTHYNKIQLLDGSLSANGSTGNSSSKITVHLSMSDAALSAGAMTTTDGVEGAYQNGSALAADANKQVSDITTMTVNYKDANGTLNSIEVKLSYQTATTMASSDGAATYSVTSGAATAAQKDAAFLAELKKTELGELFDITSDGAGKFTFEAKEKGSAGATVMSMTTGGTQNGSTTRMNETSQQVSATTTASDAFQSVTADIGSWDGTSSDNLDDHVFEVNGKKFAYVDEAGANELRNHVNEYGDINFVQVATDGTVANADVEKMADLVNSKTGLAAEADAATNTTLNLKTPVGGGTTAGNGGLTFQIGANGSKDQRVTLSVEDMSTAGIGVKNLTVATQTSANKAMEIIDKAINTVSKQRSGLGALQNRLEHTVNNLGTTSENLSAAESRIRDVDMAKEMVQMSKNNILTQAAQAMLAQANTQPQGVLQLLK